MPIDNNSMQSNSVNEYIDGVRNGDRTILAKAITLIESNSPEHIDMAQAVLRELLPYTGKSTRIGITGMPGAGKSTFIEALGCHLTESGHKIAVLAVDPSSSISRGSILGDKTRMEKLSQDPNAFIRPSPSGGVLGGVARKTRESMLLFEAAGYDVLLIETIGVGQNEITVRSMVDFILLLMIAGAGDELQGIKKGIIEIADAIVFNKADGDNKPRVMAAREEYEKALHYLYHATEGWTTRAHACSSITGEGITDIWQVIEKFKAITTKSKVWDIRRKNQQRDWLHALVEEHLSRNFFNDAKIKDILPQVEQDVMEGKATAIAAARRLLGE
ncbi:MAG: methylmalonyl Co-A mutase-associated GTPase MeaB [candidate division Zixibacteria bacterium]|nr:methylmalonyl Co-A mutase-associated GTPase MeaB [candidate division Zixibacteria bacterium]